MYLKLVVLAALAPFLLAGDPPPKPFEESKVPEPAPVAPVLPKYSDKVQEANCDVYGEGTFVFGCSSEFFVCRPTGSGFIKDMMRCPMGHNGHLIIDPMSNRCTYPSEIRICQEVVDTDKATKIIQREPFACRNRGNGYYAIDSCSQEYAYCYGGQRKTLTCGTTYQFFNEITNKCESKAKCRRSSGPNQPPPGVTGADVKPISFSEDVNMTLIVPTGPLDCVGNEGLLFNEGKCQTTFSRCTRENGTVVDFKCPNGLVFSEQLQKCTYKINAPECSEHQLKNRVEHPEPNPLSVNCTGLPDGFHGIAKCYRDYFQCSNNHSLVLSCPKNKVFNIEMQTCDIIDNCIQASTKKESVSHLLGETVDKWQTEPFSCNGKEPGTYELQPCHQNFINCEKDDFATLTTCTNGFVYNSGACIHRHLCVSPENTEIQNSTAPSNFTCKDKEDGSYEDGKCLPYFVLCVNEVVHRMDCQKGLYFSKGQCVWLSLCENPLPPPPPTPAASAKPEEPIAFDCEGRTGTFEEAECHNTFIVCSNGIPHRLSCPAKLRYSSEKGRCTWEKLCLKLKRGSSHVLPTYPPSLNNSTEHEDVASKPEMQPTATQTRRKRAISFPAGSVPVAQLNMESANPYVPDYVCPSDGWFTEGHCLNFYIQCSNTYAYRVKCAANLRWRGDTCVWPRDCFDTPTKTRETHFHPQIQAAKPKEVVVNKCTGKASGFYAGSLCAADYYECVEDIMVMKKCLSGNVFNVQAKKCDHPFSVVECEGRIVVESTAVPTTQITAVEAEPEFNCVGKPEGHYDTGLCSNFSYYCHNGSFEKRHCPENFFYDRGTQECHVKEHVPSCGGTRPTGDVHCYGIPSGFSYGTAGCHQYYFTCESGISKRKFCPTDLFFDSETSTCIQKAYLPVCGGTRPTPAPTPEPFVDPFCQGKADGYHGLGGCQRTYYSCLSGVSTNLTCSKELFYDPDIASCEKKHHVPVCGGERPFAEPSTGPAPTLDPLCAEKPNGIYQIQECSNAFYQCHSGYTERRTCPPGLFYDADLDQCEKRALVPACGGTRPSHSRSEDQVLTQDTYCEGKSDGLYMVDECSIFLYHCAGGNTKKLPCAGGLYYDYEEEKCEVKSRIPACGGTRPTYRSKHLRTAPSTTATPPRPRDTYCVGKADGRYLPENCSTFAYVCIGGIPNKEVCPGGLYYDLEDKKCELRNYLPACGGIRPTEPPTTPQPTQPSRFHPAGLDTFCDGKENGYYSSGDCVKQYFLCEDSVSYKFFCPGRFAFNPESKSCVEPWQIPACGITPPTQPPTTTKPPTETPRLHPAGLDTFCEGKDDGNYALGDCEKMFYTCDNFVGYKVPCPAGFLFDPILQTCEKESRMPACTGPPTMPSPQESSLCVGKENGNYPNGACSSNFYKCRDGELLMQSCPPGYLYDPPTQNCLQWTVEICKIFIHKEKPTPQVPKRKIPSLINAFDCLTKSDGDYSLGCSDVFVTCSNNIKYTRFCATTGIRFSQELDRCDYEENVSECSKNIGGNQTTVTPST